MSETYEQEMGKQQYEQIINQFGGRILPEWHPHVKLVRRVLERLIPASGLEGQEWEVNVIDDKAQLNAFVIPGYVLPFSSECPNSSLGFGGKGEDVASLLLKLWLAERSLCLVVSSQYAMAKMGWLLFSATKLLITLSIMRRRIIVDCL